ncbi:MAG TPA: hypothetical protein VMU78_08115 [Methylocella sp.]|nr:hypothetical protein [Methylocella sp.]
MTTDPFAAGTLRSPDSWLKRNASLIAAGDGLIVGLSLAGSCGFPKSKENSGGATTN